jgi:outer membrane protein OmpU
MKKVLFATTALVASAGFAAADIEFSGSASAGIFDDGLGGGFVVYNGAELTATMTGETDGGLTFGTDISVAVGTNLDGFDPLSVEDGIASGGAVWIEGAFGKLTFDNDGNDNLYDDDKASHDLAYSYSNGGISVGLTYDVDGTADADWSASAGYDMDALSVSIATDEDGEFSIAADYDVNAEVNVGLSHDTGTGVSEITAAYDNGSVSADFSYDTDEAWSVGVGYSMDAWSVAAEFDSADAWELTGSYDLGGGASVEAGVNSADVMYAGVALSF